MGCQLADCVPDKDLILIYSGDNQGISDQKATVSECYYIAGDFDFLLKVLVMHRSILEEVLNDIKSIDGVSLTRTTMVLSTNEQEACLLPDK